VFYMALTVINTRRQDLLRMLMAKIQFTILG
jgi:hypothetical protein